MLPVVVIAFEPAAIIPIILPPVILPVPVITPLPNPRLPTLALPLIFAVPVILAPVPVTTNTLALPTADKLILAFATIDMLLLPLINVPVK